MIVANVRGKRVHFINHPLGQPGAHEHRQDSPEDVQPRVEVALHELQRLHQPRAPERHVLHCTGMITASLAFRALISANRASGSRSGSSRTSLSPGAFVSRRSRAIRVLSRLPRRKARRSKAPRSRVRLRAPPHSGPACRRGSRRTCRVGPAIDLRALVALAQNRGPPAAPPLAAKRDSQRDGGAVYHTTLLIHQRNDVCSHQALPGHPRFNGFRVAMPARPKPSTAGRLPRGRSARRCRLFRFRSETGRRWRNNPPRRWVDWRCESAPMVLRSIAIKQCSSIVATRQDGHRAKTRMPARPSGSAHLHAEEPTCPAAGTVTPLPGSPAESHGKNYRPNGGPRSETPTTEPLNGNGVAGIRGRPE